MNRRLLLVGVVVILYLTASAFAGTDPPPPAFDAPAFLKAVYTAVTSKNWGLVAGLGLIALVYPLRMFGPKFVKTQWGGLALAFATSLAGTFGAAFAAGAKPDLAMVVTALTTSATAAGLWEWLKAHLPGVQTAATAATKVEIPVAVAQRDKLKWEESK